MTDKCSNLHQCIVFDEIRMIFEVDKIAFDNDTREKLLRIVIEELTFDNNRKW